MKKQYKLAILAIGALALGSCANHDLIPDISQVGQAVPTCYWEVGSTVCKAGETFTFQGKYTVEPGKTPDRSEVWYEIVREDVATVTSKLAGTALSYSQTATVTEVMRAYQSLAKFEHALAEWDGHEFIVNGEVAVSRTLSPVNWVDAPEWSQETYDSYYPAEFAKEYLDKVIGYLTDPATTDSYYAALRNVYINYHFTNEQFAAQGFPTIPEMGEDGGSAEKSDLWFSTTEASDAAIVGKYYVTVGDDGKAVYHEVAADYADASVTLYPVYKSAPWVFCRYDDNKGGIVSTVRPEYLPKFRALLEQIPFQDWIYDTANACYKVEFSRKYSLNAQYRVYDTEGNEGIAADVKVISIN